jgi:hypothetical protein
MLTFAAIAAALIVAGVLTVLTIKRRRGKVSKLDVVERNQLNDQRCRDWRRACASGDGSKVRRLAASLRGETA